jgi:hypothetical protein
MTASPDRPPAGYLARLLAMRRELLRELIDADPALAGSAWEAAQLGTVRRLDAELARRGVATPT